MIRKHGRWARADLGRCAMVLLLSMAAPAAPAYGFGLDDVAAKAKKLAEEPFEDARGRIPDWLTKLTYDQWRDVRFRAEHALWADARLPFRAQFFHPGMYYDRAVAIHVVDSGGIRPVAFSPSLFDYGKNEFASRVPQDLGFAGFRIHAPIKTRNYYDEVVVFLGASYFRAVGRSERFGASARGLAVDTAESWGEEFPYFKEFWLQRPTPGASTLTIYALLDSPSASGAYKFVVQPGAQTNVEVDVRLYRRKEIRKLGIGPLTSMFFFGENAVRPVENFRPEVHDSDGLLMADGSGEWLWRPLENPRTLRVNGFALRDPKGFGLVQRDRNFDHYQDLETRQEERPSVWVAPRGGWGSGRVELVQIPTKSDANDNIVAFWVPEKLPPPREPVKFGYAMSWYGDDPKRPPAGRAIATRREPGTSEGAVRVIVDFEGKKLTSLPAETVLRGVVNVAGGDEAGEILEQQVLKNAATGGWRLSFQVRPKQGPVELRAFLEHAGSVLTETWTYELQS